MIRSKLTRNANRFYGGEILFTRRVQDNPEFSFYNFSFYERLKFITEMAFE